MTNPTLTAPLAIVQVKGVDGQSVKVGKMKNVRITENFRRGRVVGLGRMNPSEVPALDWEGTMSASQYLIKLEKSIWNMADRRFSSPEEFFNHIIFQEGFEVALLKKVRDAQGVVNFETFASVPDVFITTEGLDVSEGQIGGKDGSFVYMTPVLYPITA